MGGISIMCSKFRVTAKEPELNGAVVIVNRTRCSLGRDNWQPLKICLIYLTKRNEDRWSEVEGPSPYA